MKKFKKWSHQELIKSLDVYKNLKARKIPMTANQIQIQKLAQQIGRSVSSVVMRMANFTYLDTKGEKGLSNGGKNLFLFWKIYA